ARKRTGAARSASTRSGRRSTGPWAPAGRGMGCCPSGGIEGRSFTPSVPWWRRANKQISAGRSRLTDKLEKEESLFSLLPHRKSLGFLVVVVVSPRRPLVVAEEKQPARQEDRTDQYGDPLPPGALARIGTVRFRTGSSVMTVRFSPDGKTLASVGHDAVVLWDPRTGKELRRRQTRPAFYWGNFSPDGRKLWLQTYEGAISVWD